MIVLGEVKLWRGEHFRCNDSKARGGQARLEGLEARQRCFMLRVIAEIDARPILSADVVPLAHTLSGVMVLPE